jgi:hypothetical protein
MNVSPHDRPVFLPVLPLAEAKGCDVLDRALGPKLEVVGTD